MIIEHANTSDLGGYAGLAGRICYIHVLQRYGGEPGSPLGLSLKASICRVRWTFSCAEANLQSDKYPQCLRFSPQP